MRITIKLSNLNIPSSYSFSAFIFLSKEKLVSQDPLGDFALMEYFAFGSVNTCCKNKTNNVGFDIKTAGTVGLKI